MAGGGVTPSLFSDPSPRAIFSPCGRYRYALSRVWGDTAHRCLFVMLNPSTADAEQDDPTIRRCIGFARDWGFGALDVANLFAWRSRDPKALCSLEDPIGPENDEWIRKLASRAGIVVCAWGNHGALGRRGEAVVKILLAQGRRPQCLDRTSTGEPTHPLYQPKTAQATDLIP